MNAKQFIDKYNAIFAMKQEELSKHLVKFMKSFPEYNEISVDGSFHLFLNKNEDFAGCLVAHIDTVHEQPKNYEMVAYNNDTEIWSPSGLGADDRAGVATIIEVLESGMRPHILFTWDEEMGCVGSTRMTGSVKRETIEPINYFLQVDRRGANDIVFYSNDNYSFQQAIIAASGDYFETKVGSFTDIETLQAHYEIPGANVSAGYYSEHSLHETFNVEEWTLVTDAVKKILNDAEFNVLQYAYVPAPKIYSGAGYGSFANFNSMYGYEAESCNSVGGQYGVCANCGYSDKVNEHSLCEFCATNGYTDEYVESVCSSCLENTPVGIDSGICDNCKLY